MRLWIVFASAVLAMSGARADQALVRTCGDLSDPPATISACSSAIASGTWRGAGLAWAHNNMGLARAARGDYLGAIAAYTQALTLDPAYAASLSNRGNAHAALGDMLAALADHERAVALDPAFVAAHHNRAVDLEELGQYAEALKAYRETIRLAPDHAGSHVGLATSNCKLGRVKASAEARLSAINKGLLDPTDMQRLLQGAGHYAGPIDGLFGKKSRAALWAWTRKGCLAGA